MTTDTTSTSTTAQGTTTDMGGMGFLETRGRTLATVYLPLCVFLFVLLFPFYWMGITAFKPNNELLSREGNPFWIISPDRKSVV